MAARIYKPAKTAMQQGKAQTRDWVLEFIPDEPSIIEPLMGWTSTTETRPQVRMSFTTKDEAVVLRHAPRHRFPPRRATGLGSETEILCREFQIRADRPLDALTRDSAIVSRSQGVP